MSLSQSNFSKSLVSVVTTVGLVTIGNFIFIDAANAFGVSFSNGGFESTTNNSPDSWSTTGDVTTNTGIDGIGISPISGSNQAIITNSYKIESDRNDDSSYTFNQSGNNPVDADTITTNHTGNDLQTSLGLGTYDLSIDRATPVSGFPRTSKEGSGMYQDITVNISAPDVTNGTNGFKVKFNWAYLTNDGQEDTYGLGNQDYSFISIVDTSTSSSTVNVLGDSSNPISTIPILIANNDYVDPTTTYYDANNVYTESVTGLTEGEHTYRVGFGVVDVDGYDRSSALLLDEFMVEQVPFEFSPALGLLVVGGIFGLNYLRHKFSDGKQQYIKKV